MRTRKCNCARMRPAYVMEIDAADAARDDYEKLQDEAAQQDVQAIWDARGDDYFGKVRQT